MMTTMLVAPVDAQSDINNKFGIHLADPSRDELEQAAQLVNTNGGDWGYVTIVIREDDKDRDKWQSIFDEMRKLHLIPIVRIATKIEDGSWRRPQASEAQEWATFLDSLRWVVKDRYVVLFNEVNHASEWGGAVDPKGYAEVAYAFARTLRAQDDHFVVMLAGFDLSAPDNEPRHADEAQFLDVVFKTVAPEKWNEVLGGWSSHAYPNPAFAGSPNGYGRISVRGYEWELQLLETYGIDPLPVFITETGWNIDNVGSAQTVAENFQSAYLYVWLPDDRVRAVTPFVLKYEGEPFEAFAWMKEGGERPLPHYEAVISLPKVAGQPAIVESGAIAYDLPRNVVTMSTYHIDVTLRNDGQGVWGKGHGYRLVLDGIDPDDYLVLPYGDIAPGQEGRVTIIMNTKEEDVNRDIRVVLMRNDEAVVEGDVQTVTIVPLPDVSVEVLLFPKGIKKADGEDFEINIYDQENRLVYKQDNISVVDGKGVVHDVHNITLNQPYRVVLLKSLYLPRQSIVEFKKDTFLIVFDPMMPFDLDSDGNFGWDDIGVFLRNPRRASVWWPW